MRGGFTFCGVDIADLGIEYAPDNADTYIYQEAKYKVDDESIEAHDGGYHYGQALEPKEIRLRCYFSEEENRCQQNLIDPDSRYFSYDAHINHGRMSRIVSFFKRGKTGRLIFKDRPWLYYTATIVSSDYSNLMNAWNGLFTITMKAYYPFARTDDFYIDEDNELMINNTSMISIDYTPDPVIVEPLHPLLTEKSFILLNGGSERADVAITIAGDVGQGVTIYNDTTGQECAFVGISKNETTAKGKHVVCDSLNGNTIITDGNSNTDFAFVYHDHGFIQLAPSFPAPRCRVELLESRLQIIASDVYLSAQDIVGKYFVQDGLWKIIDKDDRYENTYIINTSFETKVKATLDLLTMNELRVVPTTTMNLDKLELNYKHTFE